MPDHPITHESHERILRILERPTVRKLKTHDRFIQSFPVISRSDTAQLFADCCREFYGFGIEIDPPTRKRDLFGAEDSACLLHVATQRIAAGNPIADAILRTSIGAVRTACFPRPGGGSPVEITGDVFDGGEIVAFRLHSYDDFDASRLTGYLMRRLAHIGIGRVLLSATAASACQNLVREFDSNFNLLGAPNRQFESAEAERLRMAALLLSGATARTVRLADVSQLERWSIVCNLLLWIAAEFGIELPPESHLVGAGNGRFSPNVAVMERPRSARRSSHSAPD